MALLELQTYELVFPEHANPNGAAFGGFVLGLMDKVASYAAAKHARNPVVTVAVGSVQFKVPIRVGDLLEVKAAVVACGRTSISVDVDVYRDTFGGKDDNRVLATSGRLTFVAVDDKGQPKLL